MMDSNARPRLTVVLGLVVLLAGAAPVAADNWPQEFRKRQEHIEAFLRSTKAVEIDGRTDQVNGYEWFANIPPGVTGVEGIPLVLFRLLPDLAKRLGDRDPKAPDEFLFGEPDQNFARFGFFTEDKARPLPLGFAWTRPSAARPLSIAVRTCASCHVGRVRVDDEAGTVRVIHGAPNTEVLLHQYNVAMTSFLHRHLDAPAERVRFKRELLALIDEKAKESPTWFFRNVGGMDAAAEARQVADLKASLLRPEDRLDVLVPIQLINSVRTRGYDQLRAVAYNKPNSPELDAGPPGLFDSSGLGLTSFVGPADLFPGAAKNDIPAVWNQSTRRHWQWDGNVRDTLARNMVASLGLVGLPQDLDIAANYLISEFIDGLPPAPYPFDADSEAARRGEVTYRENCATCHRPDQARDGRQDPPVYRLGTDLNRARVVTPGGFLAIQQVLVNGYQPESLTIRHDGREVRPNRIDPDAQLVDRTVPRLQGYVAGPLDGLWARAPYLHNGSVPTLRHLLAPKLRAEATQFVRGIISYDRKNVGWVWRLDDLPAYRGKDRTAGIYDTTLDGQSNTGHDRLYVKVGGRVYRMSWDDPDDRGLNDLLEYLKTL